MGHSIGDALIVAALAAIAIAYLHHRHRERLRRLEVIHQERLAAMEKGIPLPELPLDPTKIPKAPDPTATLLHGIVWTAFGLGGMLVLWMIDAAVSDRALWPLPLPIALLGFGLILYYVLAANRSR